MLGGKYLNYKLLIINPGSTSTKIAVYEGEDEMLTLAQGVLRVLN